jgi:hypothetical protein
MTRNLPLIRLSAINPFLLELRQRGIDTSSMLHDLGLPTEIPASHDLFIASTTIYELVEKSARIASDPYLGFAIGSALDLADWDPITNATESASTVGELLTMFAVNAAEHTTATKFYIRTEGERSTFGFERIRKPAFRPGQNDAFYMGFMLQLLKHATRGLWEASNVLFRVADPDCIPATGEAYRVSKGGRSGVQITFPFRTVAFPHQRQQTGGWRDTSIDAGIDSNGFAPSPSPERPDGRHGGADLRP